MEIYKTIRNIVLGTFVASLPFLCDNGCNYFNKKADASAIKIQQQKDNSTQILETLIALPEK